MENMRDPLALGMELTALLVASYYSNDWLANLTGIESNLMMTILMGASLTLWIIHAYFFVTRKK